MRKKFIIIAVLVLFLINFSLINAIQEPNNVDIKTNSLIDSSSSDLFNKNCYSLSNNPIKDIKDLDDLLNLYLSDNEKENYSKILESEVYPLFNNKQICNVSLYLEIINEKLGLGIDKEIIEETSRFIKEELEDNRKCELNGLDNLEEPNIKELLDANEKIDKSSSKIKFSSIDSASSALIMDTADSLTGDTYVVLIFVDDPDNNWDSGDISYALNMVGETKNWMEDESPLQANVNINYGYYTSSISTDPNECNDVYDCQCKDWMNEAIANLGLSDSNNNGYIIDELNNHILELNNVDNVYPIFMVKNKGLFGVDSSYSCSGEWIPRIALFYYESCILGICNKHESDVYIHESLHAFSADDEYMGPWTCDSSADCTREVRWGYPNGNCGYCSGTQDSIMKCCSSDTSLWASSYTKGQIGWGDHDGDLNVDPLDNCMYVHNPSQINTDGDVFGNACDSDDDNDGIKDNVDNCPINSNPLQENNDGDSYGDICDSDDDNDGVSDINDNCPDTPGLLEYSGCPDTFPPEIAILSPLDFSWHNSNNIFTNVYAGETAKWIKNSLDNEGPKLKCNNCSAVAYNLSDLGEGIHTFTTYASDYSDNIGTETIKFYVDITRPVIHSQSPEDGSIILPNITDFKVNYTEENLKDISLNLYVIDDKPEVELFVMSHCPYGAQAEKGIIPVFELLDDKINSEIRFTHFFMHGEEELEENYRQICIRERKPDEYLDYLKCFLEYGDSDKCLIEMGINETINGCLLNKDYMWTSDYDSELSEVFGVEESPTLVINGEIVNSGRDSASYLKTICSTFDEAPEECKENLSSETPTPGFGNSNIITSNAEIIVPIPSSGGGSSEEGSSIPIPSSGGSSGGGGSNIGVPSGGSSPSGGIVNNKTLRRILHKSSCPFGINQECSFEINLSDYTDKKIKYWFSLEDIAESVTYGNISNLEVKAQIASNLTKHIWNNTIQLKDNEGIIIEFDATNDSTDLTNLFVEKQSNESDYSYMLISGLNLTSQNKTKTVYLDRIMNGTGICIRDEEILNISEISSSCTGTNEYWLTCPGSFESYNCSLVENDTRYKISGLSHSGIREQKTYCGDGIPNGGETCSSCPADVGVCLIDPPAGGGGGGSGAPAVVVNETNNETNETVIDYDVETFDESVNQTDIGEEEPRSFFSFMTGAVIGGGSGSWWVIIVVVVILVGAGFVRHKKKYFKKGSKRNPVKIN